MNQHNLEKEFKQLCDKYYIDEYIFNKVLKLFKMDLTPGPVVKKDHATTFCMITGFDKNLNSQEAEMVIRKIASEYPEQYKLIQHGDIFENSSDRCLGYRSNGMHMFVVDSKKVSIIPLSYYPDDYGSVPSIFKGIEEFPLDYWNEGNCICLGSAGPAAGWHGYYPDVAISDDLKKLIEPINMKIFLIIKKHNPDFKLNSEYRHFTLKYKNKLYVLSHYKDYNYLEDSRPYYVNLDNITIIDL